MNPVALLVIARNPAPGEAKTRLTPPCTPVEAAALAEAALLDTLDVVARTQAERKVLVLDGAPQRWRRAGFELIRQRGAGLAERLSAAFSDVGGPALLVGMDTPQLSPALLLEGLDALRRPEVDAVLGRSWDGGYWSIGLKQPTPDVFTGVPMSTDFTWRVQRERMHELGLRIYEQETLRDVDTIDDAHAVAGMAPHTRFAGVLAEITARGPDPTFFSP